MRTTTFGAVISYGLAYLVWMAYRVASHVARFPDTIYDWQRRARTRHQLMAMDDRLLKDMGISRYDALHEGTKPFWRE